MFALACNIERSISPEKLELNDWIQKYIGTFREGCFMVTQITRHISESFHLGKMEFGNIENTKYPITHYLEVYKDPKKITNTLILPFGIPQTPIQVQFYKSMLCFCYVNAFDNKEPNDEISCNVIFALIQCIIYKLSKIDHKINPSEEEHYVRIVLSLFYTIKGFMSTSKIFSQLVHSLAQCDEPKDILQREVAVILDNGPLNGPFFQQTLSLSFVRKRLHNNSKQISFANLEEFTSINAIFTITPLLKMSSDYNLENVIMFIDRMNTCNQTLMKKCSSIITMDDSKFQVSGIMCGLVVFNMSTIIGIKIGVPSNQWFSDLLKEVHMKGFNYQKFPENCPYNYKPMGIPISVMNNKSRGAIYVNGKFVSPTITELASFELNMTNGSVYSLTYENLALAVSLSNMAHIIFLGSSTRMYYNPNGSYSPITNKLYDPSTNEHLDITPIQFPLKLECTNNCIKVKKDNFICFHVNAPKIYIMFKNVELIFSVQ